nr:AB hydrolase superfamily protein B1A11.02-like [Quercus suber]POF20629.1 putative alpha/beta hydrolase [Quercus suber]
MGSSWTETEQNLERIYTNLPCDIPSDDYEIDTESWIESIAGSDGNTIFLRVTRPVIKGGLLPCVLFFHPGGMTMGSFNNAINKRWCKSLAAAGVVCVAVNFRNAWDSINSQHNPFPAGLTDCCDAVKYVHANRESFQIRNLILQGFDGGANLALAVTLKAKREEWLYQINGVYACAPYISNAYTWLDERKLRELPSLIENNGYYLHTTQRAYMAHVYTPKSADAANPLAWPYHATAADLEGLPPHILAMDEMDPLRDEGVAYCRKLIKAGVSAIGHINIGATHCASLIFRKAAPQLNREAIRSIVGFARTL